MIGRNSKLYYFFYKRNNIEKRSSGKKRRIFASAVLAVNFLFGNFKTNPTTVNPGERISNQEFNSLEFQQEISGTSSTDITKIILVKNDGILPGADGFNLNNNPRPRRNHPIGRPRMRGKEFNPDPPQIGNIPKAPPFRSFTEADTGLNALGRNNGDQCPAPKLLKALESQKT